MRLTEGSTDARASNGEAARVPLHLANPKASRELRALLNPFFLRYDTNGDRQIDRNEIAVVMRDLNEHLTPAQLDDFFKIADKDHSGGIDFDEFVDAIADYVRVHPCSGPSGSSRPSVPPTSNGGTFTAGLQPLEQRPGTPVEEEEMDEDD